MILIELESIGICPEIVVKQKKCGLYKLDKAIQDINNIEERSLEQHALNKLVERAYRKLQGRRVGPRHKEGVSKSNLEFVLAFTRRTLSRSLKFEGTKKSCFSEPSLWSVLSAPLPSSDAKYTEGVDRLKHQRLNRNPMEQSVTRWKKSNRERDRSLDGSAKGSGLKSGRHSSASGRSGERKNQTKLKQKLVQLSPSGDVLGRVTESSPIPAMQEHPEPAGPSGARITRQPRNAPGSAAQRSTNPVVTNLPGLDDNILDVPGGLDVQGNDFSSWFPDAPDVLGSPRR